MTVAMILPLLVSPPRAHITAEDLPVGSGVSLQAVSGGDGEI
jgi:hypothetical protein